jgi:thiol-disulfide isomerase/thioredoxin
MEAAGLSKPSNKKIGLSSQNTISCTTNEKSLNFYAEWCAPCKIMTPYILQMQKDLGEEIAIIRLDADKNKTVMAALKISELPNYCMTMQQ